MIKKCYVKEFQGHRWTFEQQVYTDKVTMSDSQGEFPIVELPSDMGKLLAEQLEMLQGYQDDEKKNLLLINHILDFVKENKDIDKDIIITLIENMDYLVVKE